MANLGQIDKILAGNNGTFSHHIHETVFNDLPYSLCGQEHIQETIYYVRISKLDFQLKILLSGRIREKKSKKAYKV